MSDQGRWCNHAFGLAIDSSFALAGFPADARSSRPGLARVNLELARAETLRAPFGQAAEPIGWRRDARGQAIDTDVLAHPTGGFLLEGPRGVFQVSPDGTEVRCAPLDEVAWRWQRYLLGRVLPFAATLRGLEPWHASAVAGERGAIALMGDSGAGKTTLAAHLALAGTPLMADDVISVQLCDERPVVHPGPPLMSVPGQGFSDRELEDLGSPVARTAGSLRLAVSRAGEPAPLRTVYLLRRDSRPGWRFEALTGPEPLIGGTFNFALRTPQRLSRQLEVASSMWRHARLVCVRLGPDADLRDLATDIRRDAGQRSETRVGHD